MKSVVFYNVNSIIDRIINYYSNYSIDWMLFGCYSNTTFLVCYYWRGFYEIYYVRFNVRYSRFIDSLNWGKGEIILLRWNTSNQSVIHHLIEYENNFTLVSGACEHTNCSVWDANWRWVNIKWEKHINKKEQHREDDVWERGGEVLVAKKYR